MVVLTFSLFNGLLGKRPFFSPVLHPLHTGVCPRVLYTLGNFVQTMTLQTMAYYIFIVEFPAKLLMSQHRS